MMIASTAMKPAAANRPAPMPPALMLTLSSVLASWISLEISVEMSRLASVTRRPMVGSPSDGVAGVAVVQVRMVAVLFRQAGALVEESHPRHKVLHLPILANSLAVMRKPPAF